MKATVIKSSELGTNCWLPVRFCGGRCQRVMDCTYPEKQTCKAVQTEIDYLKEYHQAEIEKHQKQLATALKELKPC